MKKKQTEQKQKPEGAGRRAEVVSRLLEQVERKLDSEVKASLGDYIRLVQLQKELEDDDVREIKITWVDPEEEPKTQD